MRKGKKISKIFGIALVCLMIGAMFGGSASLEESVATASSTDLPPTIRVLRLSTGEVDTVDFKLYTKRVLPHEWSEEWIRHWPDESLKAGAMAVKTYAWYWVDQGGRPPHSPDADVCDGPHCQVYKEETSSRTNNAVEATWLKGMRKGGQIFESQYWDGRAIVNVGAGHHLNIRDNPGTSSTVIAQANDGDKLCVLSNGLTESDGFHWFFIKTGDITEWDSYITGWVAGEYVNSYPGGYCIVNYANRMTQWGTVYWADQGKDYQWILSYFYPGIEFFDIPIAQPPIASASDISGQPKIMHPDILYEVTSKYYDPDGRTNLKWCFLGLTHPTDTIVVSWIEATATPFEDSEYITFLDVSSTPITNSYEGYQLILIAY